MKYLLLITILIALISCTTIPDQATIIRDFKNQTGLKEVPTPSGHGTYLGKTYKDYQILFTAEAGDVWGRWAARVTLAEVMDYLSDGKHRVPVAGSQLDRLLSRVIGQPLTITVIAKHNKSKASRLDIITPFSTIKSDDPQPKTHYLGLNSGSIYSSNQNFADRIYKNKNLLSRISKLRSPYFRVDNQAITYIYSGPETDLSAMIREHGSYANLINSIIEILADIGNEI